MSPSLPSEPSTRGAAATVSLLIPVFNEGAAIIGTLQRLEAVLAPQPYAVEVVIVNDGSHDDTLAKIQTYQSPRFTIVVVDLSRNFGKEAALSAGLQVASGDAVIPIDADLQDPPELIPEMIERWRQGAEVVVAHRSDRRSDSAMKRLTASGFYRLINRIAEVQIPDNVGDFRLMDRTVVDVVCSLPENRRFMKGLFAWAGFRTERVEYVRQQRAAGQSKFNGFRLINLAVEGITSFSTAPLRLATYAGALVAAAAFCYVVYIVVRTLIFGVDLPGYASLISVMLFMSGVQLLALGLIGEYVGRTYMEAKRRPAFVIRKIWRNAATDPGPKVE
ncbi:glycosyltransferase family 2 protein [Pseudomarimonas arenosa]|uniref:Glycosyltransferase family 2 protein n=1 Tax=Pseudomarimonas arenosa TaxID=2774145 RepID=A0AAW3ZM05_9GAMM|nr:glycosyltransferase family 2 protein [Pseudomarimonas arenosa]MBD8526505.1 glycosyltransferase family 2 protein [Pseudomarimonas arenosa]